MGRQKLFRPLVADASNLFYEGVFDGIAPARTYHIDTVSGDNDNDGLTWNTPVATMAQAFALALAEGKNNPVFYVLGDVREEVLSPLGIQGGKIVGAANGNTRHDDGVRWREPASGATTGGALLTLREQGWEVHNILFVPKSDGTALRIRRAEDATYPDGSHAIISNCKFIGAATATTIGIEDHGGAHHWVVEDCEFATLATAIKHTTGAGIASPLRDRIRRCTFTDDITNAIVLPGNDCIVEANIFGDHTVVINTSGGTAGKNWVLNNVFRNIEADIDNAHGYTGHAADMWRNFSSDVAAMTVGVPGA